LPQQFNCAGNVFGFGQMAYRGVTGLAVGALVEIDVVARRP